MSPHRRISFFVPGVPATAGSKRYVGTHGGKARIVDMCARKTAWCAAVAAYARIEYQGPPVAGALAFEAAFYFDRPRKHFVGKQRGHALRDDAPADHLVKPDVLKLARAAEDALTGILYQDDAQIFTELLSKHYTDARQPNAGARITLTFSEKDHADGRH